MFFKKINFDMLCSIWENILVDAKRRETKQRIRRGPTNLLLVEKNKIAIWRNCFDRGRGYWLKVDYLTKSKNIESESDTWMISLLAKKTNPTAWWKQTNFETKRHIKKVSKKIDKIIGKEGESKAKDVDSTEQKNL